jgi:S-DNA-T family DNA segregation ATPase FtsK/SpoIIIE
LVGFLKYFLISVGTLIGIFLLFLAIKGFWRGLLKLRRERQNEIIGILLFLIFIFLVVSLCTYRSSDVEGLKKGEIFNYGGVAGFYISHWLLRYIGVEVFLVCFLFPFWGFFLVSHKNLEKIVKPSALIIFLTYWFNIFWALPPFKDMVKVSIPISGMVGKVSAGFLSKFTGVFGVYIILLVFLIILLFTFTGLSFLTIKKNILRMLNTEKERGVKEKKKERRKEEKKEEEKKPEVDVEQGTPPQVTIRSSEAIMKVEIGDEFKRKYIDLLNNPSPSDRRIAERELKRNAERLVEKLENFGVSGTITSIGTGPVITRYEFEPGPGIKVSSVSRLADDLALAMKAPKIRIVAPIPGKGTVGIEVPNKMRENVYIKESLMDEDYNNSSSILSICLGKDIAGETVTADIARMPHLLIAGATGSGKSVCINSIIASILYRAKPRDVRFILIDPKRLELPVYNGIPHLIFPVLTEAKESIIILRQVVKWMDIRYKEFARVGVRDIEGYNRKMKDRKPYILVIVDELADLMIQASRDIESILTRLAQMSRAVGIHLILATQRPSVDVITGLIKANFPARIAFQVASMTDSRTILDMIGAEKLLGRGDMLFLPPGKGTPVRLHGAYISTDEAKSIANLWASLHLKNLLRNEIEHSSDIEREMIENNMIEAIVNADQIPGAEERIEAFSDEIEEKYGIDKGKLIQLFENIEYYPTLEEQRFFEEKITGKRGESLAGTMDEELDEYYDEAKEIVIRHGQASVSLLQRKLKVGYARAGRLIDQLERKGVVGPFEGSKPRKVLIGDDENEYH